MEIPMRTTLLAGFGLLAALAVPPDAVADGPVSGTAPHDVLALLQDGFETDQYGPRVRIWLDGNRDLLRAGDHTRVLIRTDADAYLAVFHIATSGDVELLYPRSYRDDGWVRGGQTLALGSRGDWSFLRLQSGPGMGYVFAVALDEPLYLGGVRDLFDRRLASWNSRWTVTGDPFYAMDRIVHDIVPEGAWGYESVDHYTYHVGARRYTHPRFACYDAYGDWYYGRAVYYTGCDRVRILLVARPYYYDTRYWRGSRRVYYERYYRPLPARAARPVLRQPAHGYKERTDARIPPARVATHDRRPEPVTRRAPSAQERRDEPQQETRPSTRQRPQLQRRPQEREAEPPAREAETPAREARPPAREAPAREARPQQREAPPPARESPPPARTAPPRATPAARQDAPARQDPPARDSRARESRSNEGRSGDDARSRSTETRDSSPPQRSAPPSRRP
jgi:hypothetical protein